MLQQAHLGLRFGTGMCATWAGSTCKGFARFSLACRLPSPTTRDVRLRRLPTYGRPVARFSTTRGGKCRSWFVFVLQPKSWGFACSVSPQEFFTKSREIPIRYPDLPCITYRAKLRDGTSRNCEVPMELCEVLPNQVFKRSAPGDVMQRISKSRAAEKNAAARLLKIEGDRRPENPSAYNVRTSTVIAATPAHSSFSNSSWATRTSSARQA